MIERTMPASTATAVPSLEMAPGCEDKEARGRVSVVVLAPDTCQVVQVLDIW